MVLLCEQTRLYGDEAELINDGASYFIDGSFDWTSIKSYNITLDKEAIVLIRFNYGFGGVSTIGNARVVINDYWVVWASGAQITNGWTNQRSSGDVYVILPAGNFTVDFQCATINSAWAGVRAIKIGKLCFRDQLGTWDGGTVQLPAGQLTSLIQRTVTVPQRVLPIGRLKQYAMFLRVVAFDAAGSPARRTRMKNAGEWNDAGRINVRLYINGAAVDWTARANDDAYTVPDNPSFGVGSYGEYVMPVAADQQLTVDVRGFASAAASARCFLTILFCPWITPARSGFQPARLDFPQGSTFYAVLEPLNENSAAKKSKIGKKRFTSFGDATDFYSTVSGLGILTHSYTFDIVDVDSAEWEVDSTTFVCVSYIGVDTR